GLQYLLGNKPMGIRYKEEPKASKGAGVYTANVGGKAVVVEASGKDGSYTAKVNGKSYEVKVSEGGDVKVAAAPASGSAGGAAITAPIPGTVMKVLVSAGDRVSAGDTLLVLEALKMENEIKATQDGTVGEIKVAVGDSVAAGATLVTLN
ncbi:MAG: biotin/lipoyl-binding protein, partial [Victivallaceae bacterium]|nr:biotin/lipoyl-binding protein [Victivallaceae bacterium]